MKSFALSLLAALVFSGCVSIPLYERVKEESYKQGRVDGLKSALTILKENNDVRVTELDLRTLLGCSQFEDTRKK